MVIELESVINAIEIIRIKIKKHESLLVNSETLTRYVLIDPLLRALDWDLSDPDQVTTESRTNENGRMDYVLGQDMVIEVKKLNEQKMYVFRNQLRGYLKSENVRYGVLTDGRFWQIYDKNHSLDSAKTEFHVTGSMNVVLPNIMYLHRQAVQAKIPSDTDKTNSESGSQIVQDATILSTPTKKDTVQETGVPIDKFSYKKGMGPPMLKLPDNKRVKLKKWIQLQTEIAEWLIKNKKIGKKNCPVVAGPKNSVMNTVPFHPNHKQFRTPKTVCDTFFVETNTAPEQSIRYAIKLIEVANMQPTDFRLESDA